MIFQKFEDIESSNFPVVIFGSGPAGITTALELENKKIPSIIIEAGNEEYNENSQDVYKGSIIGDQLANLSSSRLRQLGGTSGHWGGWCKPLENYTLEDWPINKKDLDKYSNQTCAILNIKNKFNKSKLNDYFNQIEYQYSGVRFGEKYKQHIQKSKMIHLLMNCHLSHFEGENKTVTNAVCKISDSFKKIKSKYFILACGGIENSRVLLWTREKNKKLISKNLPVGEYWMNHPWIISGIGVINKKKLRNKLGNNYLNYEGPLHFESTNKLIKEKKILSAAIYMNAKEDTKFYKEIIKDILCIAPEYGKKIARSVFKKDLKCGNIFMNLEEPALKNNKITLDNKERDKFDIPRVKLFYKQSKESLLTAKKFLEEFANLCRDEDLGRIAMKENIYDLENFENLGGYHHLGGTRIGINKSNSVVDKNLKVHDVNNLFVSGSSIFFTGGYTHPTYSIVQLALRLADKLGADLNT